MRESVPSGWEDLLQREEVETGLILTIFQEQPRRPVQREPGQLGGALEGLLCPV